MKIILCVNSSWIDDSYHGHLSTLKATSLVNAIIEIIEYTKIQDIFN